MRGFNSICAGCRKGGADRIELCSALSKGGLTPSAGTMKYACKKLSIPVFMLIRPRTGDFNHTDAEFESMLADIRVEKNMEHQELYVVY